MTLSDNFFSNFEEITNKYDNPNKINEDNEEKNNNPFNLNLQSLKDEEEEKEYKELLQDIPNGKELTNNIIKEEPSEDSDNNYKVTEKDFFCDELTDNNTNDYNGNNKINNNNSSNDSSDEEEQSDNNNEVKKWDISNSNCLLPNLKELSKPQIWDEDLKFIISHIFGYKTFRPLQREIINANLMDKDIFACMPTGSGKSLCYQIPAIMSTETVTVVVMPLISLILDQSKFLTSLGVKVLYLEGGINPNYLNFDTMFRNENPEERIKIIFITPEKLNSSTGTTYNLLSELYNQGLFKRIVIDEAHCVSQWGKDFRPHYLELKKIKANFPDVAILALTATAPKKMRDDIIFQLGMKNTLYFQLSNNRPNLYLEIRNKKSFSNPIEDMAKIIQKYYSNKTGIVYCNSKALCEKISKILNKNYNINCGFYHAGLSDSKRREIQEDWMNDEIKVVIATIAFGMGINKLDVRFVIHYDMPKSFETYYQEIGRAGRDGEPSRCIIYYQPSDKNSLQFLLSKNLKNPQQIEDNLRRLTQMVDYCEEEFECRRVTALSYFDESFKKEDCHYMCDNCNKRLYCENKDVTKECKIILGLLNLLTKNHYQFTANQISDYLKGKKELGKGFSNKKEYYSKLSNYDIKDIHKMIRYLIIKKYINEELICGQFSTYAVIKISTLGEYIYFNQDLAIKISFKKASSLPNNPNNENGIKKSKDSINYNNNNIAKATYHRNKDSNNNFRSLDYLKYEYLADNTKDYGLCEPIEFEDLLQQLKEIRRNLLKRENGKIKNESIDGVFIPFTLDDIFTDTGLKELVRKLPTKSKELKKSNIFGISEANLKKYGNEFLPTIAKFINVYNINVAKRKEEREKIFKSTGKTNIPSVHDTLKYLGALYIDTNGISDDGKKENNSKINNFGSKRNECDDDEVKNVGNEESKVKGDCSELNRNSEVFNKLASKNKRNKKAKFL